MVNTEVHFISNKNCSRVVLLPHKGFRNYRVIGQKKSNRLKFDGTVEFMRATKVFAIHGQNIKV